MSTIPKGFKKLKAGDFYFSETETTAEISDLKWLGNRDSLYDKVAELEQQRAYSGYDLRNLAIEINARVKITTDEIFKIGELLYRAKKLCSQEKIKFQDWIEKSVNFSYETANNFMHVFRYCFGLRHVAMQVSPSILYKVSAPGFPEEFRDYLFRTGRLEKMTNGMLGAITKRYREGGYDAIRADVEKLNDFILLQRQTRYTFDLCHNALKTLQAMKTKLPNMERAFIEDDFQPEALAINKRLVTTLEGSIAALDKAIKECEDEALNSEERIRERYQGETDTALTAKTG
jgi:hypothetical protein